VERWGFESRFGKAEPTVFVGGTWSVSSCCFVAVRTRPRDRGSGPGKRRHRG